MSSSLKRKSVPPGRQAKQLKDHVASDDFKNSISKNQEKKNRLKELADSLTEFDNPILMFVTFKNPGSHP